MSKPLAYDVVVAGAGVAGVAAALEAARAGLSVALLEKMVIAGGLATAGQINIYLPLCDGRGRQVTFGLAEELLHLSLRYGPGDVPPGWRGAARPATSARYMAAFSPASFVLALDEALAEAGVSVWYDALITGAHVRRGRLAALDVHTKSGRMRFSARCFVDATGDADVAHLAGAPCAETANWLSIWGLEATLDAAWKAVDAGQAAPLLHLFQLGGDNVGRQAPAGIPRLRGTDAAHVTRFVIEGRRVMREYYRERQAAAGPDGRKCVFPLSLPTMAPFRTTRRIVGRTTLRPGRAGRVARDSIGLAADWRIADSVWEIPYATLLPRQVTGLLAAGRCIASAGDAWEVTRVIPVAALTGQAAGAAAALAVRRGTTPDALAPADVQAALRLRGVRCHLSEL